MFFTLGLQHGWLGREARQEPLDAEGLGLLRRELRRSAPTDVQRSTTRPRSPCRQQLRGDLVELDQRAVLTGLDTNLVTSFDDELRALRLHLEALSQRLEFLLDDRLVEADHELARFGFRRPAPCATLLT